MENKARKMFAAVAVIMLCAVAIVGVGYAYTASTTNSGNTVTSSYMTMTLTGGESGTVATYSDAFDGKVTYNTETIDAGAHVRYTIDTTQYDTDIGSTGSNNAVKINQYPLRLNMQYQDATDDYFVEMVKSSGTMSADYTYKVGYKYKSESGTSAEIFKDFNVVQGLTLKASADAKFEGSAGTDRVTQIEVNLYVTGMTEQTMNYGTGPVSPLTDVSFKYTAITTDQKHSITLPESTPNGAITSNQESLNNIPTGTLVTLTFTPESTNVLLTLTLNGIDMISSVTGETSTKTLTFDMGCNDITVAATFGPAS